MSVTFKCDCCGLEGTGSVGPRNVYAYSIPSLWWVVFDLYNKSYHACCYACRDKLNLTLRYDVELTLDIEEDINE